jgi:hypothetical protein
MSLTEIMDDSKPTITVSIPFSREKKIEILTRLLYKVPANEQELKGKKKKKQHPFLILIVRFF